ncbi:MAG TPA: hypothetical protein VF653_19545 [Methylomirabilota bacterium]
MGRYPIDRKPAVRHSFRLTPTDMARVQRIRKKHRLTDMTAALRYALEVADRANGRVSKR